MKGSEVTLDRQVTHPLTVLSVLGYVQFPNPTFLSFIKLLNSFFFTVLLMSTGPLAQDR